MELLPHQEEVIDRLGNGKILYGGVGSGKSITALAYYIQKELIGDIYVITTAKKRDSLEWMRDAAHFGIGTERDATVAGVLTIDSWNNIAKYEDVEGSFFIFDEQRLVGSGAWVKSFYKIAKKNAWIILSATPGDTWMDYIPVFVANGHYTSKTDFCRQHVIFEPFHKFPKISHFAGVSKLEKLKSDVLVEMPYLSKNTRVLHDIPVTYDRDLWDLITKKRWNPYEDRPIREAAEMWALMKKVTWSDRSRLDAVRGLMEKHNKIIIFYQYNYELDLLRELNDSMSDMWSIAEYNGHKHEPIPDSENWVYLVQYTSGSEGWNCTETNCIVFWSLTYSYKQYEQAMGRIDRLSTYFLELLYYTLFSANPVDSAVRATLERKETFNERKWIDQNLGVEFEIWRDFG